MKKKATYRIRNWGQYNASLKQRGSLTIWVSPEAVENWATDELIGEPGASPTYTDLAIETIATVQVIYGLAGRQTQGFLQSVFELMKLKLTAPDHSTLSRRRRQLTISLPVKTTENQSLAGGVQKAAAGSRFSIATSAISSIQNDFTHLNRP